MEDANSTPRRRFAAVAVVIAATAVVAFVQLLKTSSVSPTRDKLQSTQVDHWRAMHAARERFFVEPTHVDEELGAVGYGDQDAWKEYVHHRDTLVRSGQLAHRKYTLDNLTATTKESEHFLHLLLDKKCPGNVDFSSSWSVELAPLKLEVWCKQGQVSDWDRFIYRHNIPNPEYRRRFMAQDRGR